MTRGNSYTDGTFALFKISGGDNLNYFRSAASRIKSFGRHNTRATYVNHPVLGRMRVRTAHVKPIAVSHWLYHSYMVSAVEVLKKKDEKERKLNLVVRRATTVAKRTGGNSRTRRNARRNDDSSICCRTPFGPFERSGKSERARRRGAKSSSRGRSRRARISRRIGAREMNWLCRHVGNICVDLTPRRRRVRGAYE